MAVVNIVSKMLMLSLVALSPLVCDSQGDSVLLTSVKTLTLHKGQFTVGRRSDPIPQLQCVGGSAQGRYEPKVVQCYNRGFDGIDVQWECKAEMSSDYQFGSVRVSCEGYGYPNDPYILKGSCGLMYELDYSQKSHKSNHNSPLEGWDSEYSFSSLMVVAFILLFCYVVYSSCTSSPRSGTNRFPGAGGRWDGGPPPPPGSGPAPPGFKPSYAEASAPPSYGEACGGVPGASTSSNSGPGFFSGLGLGGLAGYLYGRNQNSDNLLRNRAWNSYGGQSQPFGHTESFDRARRPSPSGSHTSSGFGGTVRR